MKIKAVNHIQVKPKKNGHGKNGLGGPAWDVALSYPRQGEWTEAEFLVLEARSENRLMELVDGRLEILPLPDVTHQRLVRFLFRLLDLFVSTRRLGEALFAPLPIWLWEKHLREPDLLYLATGRVVNSQKPPRGADLVMEVISPGAKNRQRDEKDKRRDYAKAGIEEYWIIDPDKETVLVLTLDKKTYKVHGKFKVGDVATSKALGGFSVNVGELFAEATA